jgi:hypothetical protein
MTAEKAFFARSYANYKLRILCSKQRFQSQALTLLRWMPRLTFSTESARSAHSRMTLDARQRRQGMQLAATPDTALVDVNRSLGLLKDRTNGSYYEAFAEAF